ncbi:MAG: hypothetical protein HY951_00605 [Bacteroidia bacterium]|nr:hypothetical protein [Bacteroidia bacterium]
MKKLYIFLFVTTILLSSCTKYEEGPKITFRSIDSRIIGDWKVTEYSCNDVDSLQYYNDSCGSNLSIDLNEGHYRRNYTVSFIGGNKEFFAFATFSNNDSYNLNVESGYDNYNKYFTGPFLPERISSWHILRLTKKELKIKVDFDNRTYRISFKKI